MDRRGFLRTGAAAIFGQRAQIVGSRSSTPGVFCPWQEARRDVVESGHYREVARASSVDWLAVKLLHASDGSVLQLQMIALDLFPEQETSLMLPLPPRWLGFQVIGPVGYEVCAAWWNGESGLSVDLWFTRPASLEVWRGHRDGEIIALTLPG